MSIVRKLQNNLKASHNRLLNYEFEKGQIVPRFWKLPYLVIAFLGNIRSYKGMGLAGMNRAGVSLSELKMRAETVSGNQ